MVRETFYALLLLAIAITSCEKDTPYAPYQGTWAGTYSGEDTGSWTADIDEEGKVEGTAVSDSLPGYPFGLTGTVTEGGMFEAEASVLFGTVDFEGQITGQSASGAWVNDEAGLEGTWKGEKD